MNDSHELRAQLAQKNQQLQEIAAQLKTELFGIDAIIDRGLHAIPQHPVRGYNIDIAVGTLAVEVHSETSYPHQSGVVARRYERIKYLADRGWHSIYVMSRNGLLVGPVTDEVVALLDLAERDPSAVGEYRVVRGSGELTSFSIDNFDQVAGEPAPVCAAH